MLVYLNTNIIFKLDLFLKRFVRPPNSSVA